MDNDNTRDANEPSPASAGSVANHSEIPNSWIPMDIQTLFFKTMTQAIDDFWLRGGPQPNDQALIAIEPRLARLLEIDADEPYEDDE
jgi:hypothetical protein